MIKYTNLSIWALVMQLVLCGWLSAQINVKDFGAKGDGVTDDTDSIQAVLSSVYSEHLIRFVPYDASFPEVVFPEGTYVISRPLVLSNWMNIRGIGNVVIRQTIPDADIFYIHWGFRNLIENICFDGGRRQIKIYTSNANTARIIIRNCKFRNSLDYAIECIIKSTDGTQQGVIIPYQITYTNGLPMLANVDDQSRGNYWYNSTFLRITGSQFVNCMRVLHSNADMCVMDNSRIETRPDMVGAAICNGALMKIEDVTGMAHVTKGNHQRWIDNRQYGLILKNTKLDSDSETGMLAINNIGKYHSSWHGVARYVIVDGCEFKCAGSAENVFIYCEEIPNLISVRNCRELSGKKIPVLGFKSIPDNNYFDAIDPAGLSFVIDDGNTNLTSDLPETMVPFAEAALPLNIGALFHEENIINDVSMRDHITHTIYATDFGAKGDNVADDTIAVQAAFDKAGETDITEVVFSNGVYRISRPIKLPPKVSVRGLGCAVFAATDDIDIFYAKDARRISILNCGFSKGRTALHINTQTNVESLILVDTCLFRDATSATINCISGNGMVNEANMTQLRISNSTFHSRALSAGSNSYWKVLVSNFHYALLDNTWISTHVNMRDSAIVNKGTLHLKNILGVPGVTRMNDQRWIDNYYRVACDDVRFGGEGAGFCLIVNKPSKDIVTDGFALIENGWTYCLGNPLRRSMVYCEAVPATIAIRSNVGFEPSSQSMVMIDSSVKTNTLAGHFFESGNSVPGRIGVSTKLHNGTCGKSD